MMRMSRIAVRLSLLAGVTVFLALSRRSIVQGLERAHPELWKMIPGGTARFLLALREMRAIRKRVYALPPLKAGRDLVKFKDMDGVDVKVPDPWKEVEGDYIKVPDPSVVDLSSISPVASAMFFVCLGDFVEREEFREMIFGSQSVYELPGPPIGPGWEPDVRIRNAEDLARSAQEIPILGLVDREIYPFTRRFELGARIEVREVINYIFPAVVFYVGGVPKEVTEAIREAVNVIREANGIPVQRDE